MESPYVPKPSSHLGLAIFTTLCCCLPFGIVAIIKASKVSDYYAMGQYQASQMASDEAKKWSLIALLVGGIGYLLYLIYVFVFGAYMFSELGML